MISVRLSTKGERAKGLMTTLFTRREAIASAGAALIAPADMEASAAAPQEPVGRAPATGTPPGESFARDLRALPRDVREMLTGQAVYVDDVRFDGEAFGVVVRSPHPHARIHAIDASAAAQASGVLTIMTGHDVARAAGPLACIVPPRAYGPRGAAQRRPAGSRGRPRAARR